MKLEIRDRGGTPRMIRRQGVAADASRRHLRCQKNSFIRRILLSTGFTKSENAIIAVIVINLNRSIRAALNSP
jgi:hypothetical protein